MPGGSRGGDLIAFELAREEILGPTAVLDPIDASLAGALGAVLARAVVADEDVPPFANTAMDGFAVRAADVAGAPVALEVVGTVAAGDAGDLRLGEGQAARIMTGAPIPPGADAVVMVERTRQLDGGSRVEIAEAVGQGNFIRHAGEDIAAGQVVFEAGTVLGPGHIGVLAGLGLDAVVVHPIPRVAVLSTGDELVEGPGPLPPGKIRNTNGPTLRALARSLGFEAVALGTAPDDLDSITTALAKGVEACDAVVCTGGVSVGDFDFVTEALGRLGPARAWSLAMKPGKPLAFSRAGSVPVFGLPGNPVSAMVSFELFVHPVLRRMAGRVPAAPAPVAAVAGADLPRRPDGKLHLVRVVADTGVDGRTRVVPTAGQGSHMLRAMAMANALALVPDGPGLAEGDDVQVLLLGGRGPAAAP